MKRTLLFAAGVLAVALAGAFVIFQNGKTSALRHGDGGGYGSPLSISIREVTDSPGRHHKKVILTAGKISSEVKVKKYGGKEYTLFKMEDGGAKINVYLTGAHSRLKTGDTIKITGRYYKKRHLRKNVLKGRMFEVLS